MKKKSLFISILSITACILMSTMCEPDPVSKVVTYSIDAAKAVDVNFCRAAQPASTIKVSTNLPFNVAAEKSIANNMGTITSDGKAVAINLLANGTASAKAYTREVIAYIQNQKGLELIEGFGEFWYPVIIRQAGALGTKYISASDLKDLKSRNVLQYEWVSGELASIYVKGKVTAIGEAYTWDGFKQDNGLYLFPFLAAISCDRKKPYELEARDITIDVDGTPVTIQATWGKAYQLLSKMNVAVGDMVEVYVSQYGIQKASDKDLLAIPTCVQKIEE